MAVALVRSLHARQGASSWKERKKESRTKESRTKEADAPIVNISPPSSIRISTTVSYVYVDGFAPERFKEIPVELSVTMQGMFRLFTSSCVSYDTSMNVPGSSVGGGA